MKHLDIMVMQDPAKPRPHPKAADIVLRMWEAGELRRFGEVYGAPSPDGLGDCWDVAAALFVDLHRAGRSHGWRVCQGLACFQDDGREPYEHWWLEFDGWALDAANGKFLVAPVGWYRSSAKAQNVVSRSPAQFSAWLDSQRERPDEPARRR